MLTNLIKAVMATAAAGAGGGSSSSSSSSCCPYHSPSSKDTYIPLAIVYTCFAHAYLFLGRNLNYILPQQYKLFNGGDDKNFGTSTMLRQLPSTQQQQTQQSKKLAIVTGSNTGIGYETAKTLVVDYGWEVILACRSKDKAIQARNKIIEELGSGTAFAAGRCVVLDCPLDLSDYESIHKFVEEYKTKYYDDDDNHHRTIDVLINNAGRNTSAKNGDLDIMFQSNYLGHFLLTIQCLKLNLITPNSGKIINVSSVMHHFVGGGGGSGSSTSTSAASSSPEEEPSCCCKLSNVEFWKSVAYYNYKSPIDSKYDGPVPESYSASKLAAILFTNELNARYGNNRSNSSSNSNSDSKYGIRSIAVNPGTVASDIWRDYPPIVQQIFKYVYLTTKQGSTTSVAAAVIDDWEQNEQKSDVDRKNNDSAGGGAGGGVTYLQPYWIPKDAIPSSSRGENLPVFPVRGKYFVFVFCMEMSCFSFLNKSSSCWNAISTHLFYISAFLLILFHFFW